MIDNITSEELKENNEEIPLSRKIALGVIFAATVAADIVRTVFLGAPVPLDIISQGLDVMTILEPTKKALSKSKSARF